MKSWFFSIFDCDPEIIMECLQQQSSVNFTPKKTMINFFFTKKKLSVRHLQNARLGDFETEPETPFGDRKFFFQRITLVLHFFGVKFIGNNYTVGMIP